jgi:hypothetical protein
MHAVVRTHWRDAVIVVVALGVIGVYLIARALDEHGKAGTFTPPRVVTAVPRARTNASANVVMNSQSTSRSANVRLAVLSVTPRPPRAAGPFALVARVAFAPAPGSIRCSVWIGGERYRKVRLVWESPTARCSGRIPEGARGKRLQIGLSAVLGGSRAQTTVGFTVS